MSNHRYGLEETELEKLPIQLLYISQASYGADWNSSMHTHHFTELFYIFKGNGFFLIEGKKLPIQEDDLIIINPNVSHTELGNHEHPMEYVALGINGLQFQHKDADSVYNYSLHHFHDYKSETTFYLKTILSEIKEKGEHFETICQNLLEAFILGIARKTENQLSIAPTKKVTKECRFIEQYINEHFSEEITLHTLSELTFLNKYYLVHAFKEYKGTSPINYLTERRILEAKHLLETTNHSISKIATFCGFSSQSYFSQVFKRETGGSPIQYRKLKEQKFSSRL